VSCWVCEVPPLVLALPGGPPAACCSERAARIDRAQGMPKCAPQCTTTLSMAGRLELTAR